MVNWKQDLSRKSREFASSRGGNIVITSALAMPVLIGMTALSVEYGGGLMKRVENQRVADLAAFAGATAYGAKSTEAAMQNAALNVARLNGLDPTKMSVALVDSPRSSGTKAVKVDVATQQNLYLARVLGDFDQLQVKAAAMAEVGSTPSQPGCLYALSATEMGITMSGGTHLSAPTCAVNSNTTITVPCGTTITTTGANYNTTTPNQPCTGIIKSGGGAAPVIKKATTDPLTGHAGIANAVARFNTVENQVAPGALTVPSKSQIPFGYGLGETNARANEAGCSAAPIGDQWSGKWKVTCPKADSPSLRVFNFGAFRVTGGITVEVVGPSDATYNFSGLVEANGGSKLTFGSGTFNFAAGLVVGGNSPTTFGSGTFRFGRNTAKCNGDDFSICNDATLTFGGPSTFELASGFYNGGGATLVFGSGTLNSYRIGKSVTNGNSVKIGGGSKTTLSDATGSNSRFELAGHVDGGGGGSCFIFPASSHHDINGNINAAGAILLGSGVYTVNGYFALGANGGGGASPCGGSSINLKGADINLIISGKNAATGSCAGTAFCATAGYSNMSLTSPKTGTLAKVAIVGPQLSTNKKGLTLAGGASGQISGVVYFPYGPILTDGGATASGANSSNADCLQIIGSSVTLKGGTSVTSECIAAGGSSAAKKVVLVQ